MGANAVGLVVDWEPVVAACASAGSMRFGRRGPDGDDLGVRSWRVRKPVEAAFAGTTCAFYWDEQGELWVRARGGHVLRRDERGELRAEPRKSGKPVDLQLPGIPGVEVRHMPGPGMPLIEAGWYYGRFRDTLPDALRRPADAFVALLYPGSAGAPGKVHDDLCVDTSVPLTSPVVYGLRPATVRRAVRHEAAVSWAALRDVADTAGELDAYETFEIAMMCQLRWLIEADARGRGVIALLSQ